LCSRLRMNPSRASNFFCFVFKEIGSTAEKFAETLLQHAARDVYTGRKESKSQLIFSQANSAACGTQD